MPEGFKVAHLSTRRGAHTNDAQPCRVGRGVGNCLLEVDVQSCLEKAGKSPIRVAKSSVSKVHIWVDRGQRLSGRWWFKRPLVVSQTRKHAIVLRTVAPNGEMLPEIGSKGRIK